MKIIRNPFKDLNRGERVWVKHRGEEFQAEFHSVWGSKVKVWDPAGVTKEIFLMLDWDDVSVDRPRRIKLRR